MRTVGYVSNISLPGDDQCVQKPKFKVSILSVAAFVWRQIVSVGDENLRANLRAPPFPYVLHNTQSFPTLSATFSDLRVDYLLNMLYIITSYDNIFFLFMDL